MNAKEREKQLIFVKGQFEIHKMYALYWQTMAITGAATTRNTCQGREPTEEERAAGEIIGWRPLTDLEKTKDALDIMKRHIALMMECNDTINNLMDEDDIEFHQYL